jgi:hypothetical protein
MAGIELTPSNLKSSCDWTRFCQSNYAKGTVLNFAKIVFKFYLILVRAWASSRIWVVALGWWHQYKVFLTPFRVYQRLERLPPCVLAQLSDAELHAARQPGRSSPPALQACYAALSQHVWKAGGPATAPVLCTVFCAATILNTCLRAYIRKGTA